MRRLTAAAVAVALLGLSVPMSTADTVGGCVERRSGFLDCTVTEVGPGVGAPGGGGPGVSVPADADILWWPVLVWEPEAGLTCVVFRREVFEGAAGSQRAEEAEARAHALLAEWSLCESSPRPAVVLPAIAREFIERVGLPVPDPHIAPGWALAGRAAFLETRATLEPPVFVAATPAGEISVDARGIYVVDWGDGTPAERFSVEGTAWPEGRIRHVYTDTGRYTVTVSIEWVADWTAATASGTATGIVTAARIVDFEVRELQAVRRR